MIDFPSTRRAMKQIKSEASEMSVLQDKHRESEEALYWYAVERFAKSLDLAIEYHRGIPKHRLPCPEVAEKLAAFLAIISKSATTVKAAPPINNRSINREAAILEFLRANPEGVTRQQIVQHFNLSVFNRSLERTVRKLSSVNVSCGQYVYTSK